MKSNWDILTKELAVHGFRLLEDGKSVEYTQGGSARIAAIPEAAAMIQSEVRENAAVLDDLWKQAAGIVQAQQPNQAVHDPRMANLFIHALKELVKLLDCFEDPGVSGLKQAFRGALNRDITSFSNEQVDAFTDLKITIDWVYRLIQRLLYINRLFKIISKGATAINMEPFKTVTAEGKSPWSNLDLPMGQRVIPFREEEENLRGREYDIRHQERYRKGFEAYNNDGRVGEGHYLRDIAAEPSTWTEWMEDKENQHRSVLFWN